MPEQPVLSYRQPMPKTSKRRRRTAAEWKQLILAWEASGKGAERFARGRDFSGSSLYIWRTRLRAEGVLPSADASMDFVPLVLEEEAGPGPDEGTQWRLETTSGEALTMCGPDAVRGLEVALRWLGDKGRR